MTVEADLFRDIGIPTLSCASRTEHLADQAHIPQPRPVILKGQTAFTTKNIVTIVALDLASALSVGSALCGCSLTST